jgi:site-specific DNA-cytosine methylase
MVIAFPPCTHLASSGARWFKEKQKDGRQEAAVAFFMAVANADIPRIAIENPVGIMSTRWRKPDQIIQPWMFGHYETKATCLWLKGLPPLVPTYRTAEECREALGIAPGVKPAARIHRMAPGPDRARLRSETYDGIAAAMADQWASIINTIPTDLLSSPVMSGKRRGQGTGSRRINPPSVGQLAPS